MEKQIFYVYVAEGLMLLKFSHIWQDTDALHLSLGVLRQYAC